MRVGLEGGDEPVEAEGDDAGADPDPPRCSRTPCQISQAPPISAIAARTNRAMDCRVVMAGSLKAVARLEVVQLRHEQPAPPLQPRAWRCADHHRIAAAAISQAAMAGIH